MSLFSLDECSWTLPTRCCRWTSWPTPPAPSTECRLRWGRTVPGTVRFYQCCGSGMIFRILIRILLFSRFRILHECFLIFLTINFTLVFPSCKCIRCIPVLWRDIGFLRNVADPGCLSRIRVYQIGPDNKHVIDRLPYHVDIVLVLLLVDILLTSIDRCLITMINNYSFIEDHDQGHLYTNLEVPRLTSTCPGRGSNPGLPRGKLAL